ncbi:hypothetical protein ACA910_016923 [Epithemia clementina (nom. ined.)]
MKALLVSTGFVLSSAWSPSSYRTPYMLTLSRLPGYRNRSWQLAMTSNPPSMNNDDWDFEFVLNEGLTSSTTNQGETLLTHQTASQAPSRSRIVLPDQKYDQRTVVLASSTYTSAKSSQAVSSADTTSTNEAAAAAAGSAESTESDPYASAFDSQMEKMQQYAERVEKASQSNSFGDRLKTMALTDIISTLIIPTIALFAAGRWAFNRVSNRVAEKTDATIDSFTREMIYHDGDFDEMKLCYQDYSRKLVFLGPKRTDIMLKAYLEEYAKKKTVSPQAIVSLGNVFKMAKLSDERVAELLVSLCRKMGADKISSAGKLLFFGSRILKSSEGRKALEPIKDIIKGTYRDASVAESLVETSQQAIAEASYRATVQAGGKKQTKLTVGWETLGLDRETAQRIFDEEAEDGFISAREAMYGLQTQKYDKKGRRITKDGKVADPEEAKEAEQEKEQESVSNAYECSQCGFTLFVAKGRESKFYGNDFKCPECGAPKDKFEARDDFGED